MTTTIRLVRANLLEIAVSHTFFFVPQLRKIHRVNKLHIMIRVFFKHIN